MNKKKNKEPSQMDKKKDKNKNSIIETVSILIAVMLGAGYFYWLVFGFPLIDNQVNRFIDAYSFFSIMISLLIFGVLLLWSYRRFKKGNNLELLNLFIYGAIALIFLISFASGSL